MRNITRVFSILFLFVFLFAATLPFVFADVDGEGINHSRLAEPVPDNCVKYFVLQNPSNGHALLFMISLDLSIPTGSNSPQYIDVEVNNSGLGWQVSIFARNVDSAVLSSTNCYLCIFDVSNGAYQGYAVLTKYNNTPGYYYYVNTNLSSYTAFLSYGCSFSNAAHCSQAKIDWEGQSDYYYQHYIVQNSLNQISDALDDISNFTGEIDTSLLAYIRWVEQTFYPAFTSQTNTIIAKLNKIIDLLGGEYESSTIAQPDQASDIDELASAEAAIQRDVGNDISSAFSNYGQVFSGNGAFALIKSGFENFILDNSKINALIVFCLTLGIGVLIIGRRIQA